jgi:hypothetical protein
MKPEIDRLHRLAQRCLTELPSRALDCDIYCAYHNIVDANDLRFEAMVDAHRQGQVLLPGGSGEDEGWVETPPFSSDRRYAEMLMPDGLSTICRQPLWVCATALKARALLQSPPAELTGGLRLGLG